MRSTDARASDIRVDTLADVADAPFAADDLCGSGTLADLPGADGQISLREAIAATNHSPGPNRITFAPELAGGTLSVSFDDLDADDRPNPLPFLCAGGTTIDGDTNGDGAPDIAIAGSPQLPNSLGGINLFSSGNTIHGLTVQDFPLAQIVVFHPFRSTDSAVVDNAITHNVARGGTYPIIIQASFNNAAVAGTLRNTTVTDNTVSGGSADGILVFVGDGLGSSITGTRIADNRIMDNARFGVLVTTHLTTAGSTSLIANTTITNNEVFNNGSTGITANSYRGQNGSITGVVIEGNRVHDNGFGISGSAGVCGAMRNSMEITIANNVLDTSGIFVSGGTNILCGAAPLPAASENVMTATVVGNSLNDPRSPGITIAGGVVSSTQNTVTASVSDNAIAGVVGVTIAGGVGISGGDVGPADGNTVNVTVHQNHVSRALAGIGITGGASGAASDNVVNAMIENNSACRSVITDIQCAGGFAGALGLPPTTGTGNMVSGSITANLATKIIVGNGVAGNACTMLQQGNAPCIGGDATCNGRVAAADVVKLLTLLYAEERASCQLDDANADGLLDVNDLPATIANIFR